MAGLTPRVGAPRGRRGSIQPAGVGICPGVPALLRLRFHGLSLPLPRWNPQRLTRLPTPARGVQAGASGRVHHRGNNQKENAARCLWKRCVNPLPLEVICRPGPGDPVSSGHQDSKLSREKKVFSIWGQEPAKDAKDKKWRRGSRGISGGGGSRWRLRPWSAGDFTGGRWATRTPDLWF